MRAVLLVIRNILAEQPLQMAFMDCDEVVQQVTAAAADPAFRYAILPRRGSPNLRKTPESRPGNNVTGLTACYSFQTHFEFCEGQVTGDQPYRFVLHDRDSIYSCDLDSTLKAMDLKILKKPFQAPKANAFCERLIGTVRRECLDFLIPLNKRHQRSLLKERVTHYNRGRPHSGLGPGIPDLGPGLQRAKPCGHHVPIDRQVVAKEILGGLNHEYRFERRAT